MLSQRMLRSELLELRHDRAVAPRREVGVDALLQRREPELSEPRDLVLGEIVELDVGERRPTPELERGMRLPAGAQFNEPVEVPLARPDVQHVTPGAMVEAAVAERAA